jgi:tetratricopeptide (TPR) repeat protein
MLDARDACRRAIAAEEEGELDRAIQHYTEAIEMDIEWADLYVFRGSVFARKGELDRAIADFTDAVKLNPRDSDAYHRRASAYRRQGDIARADADEAKSEEIRRR